MNSDRTVAADAVWARIEHLLPGRASDPGAAAADNRQFLEAVLRRPEPGGRLFPLLPVLALLLGALGVFAAAPAQAQSTDNTLSSLLVEVSTDGTTFTVPEFHPAFSPTGDGDIATVVAAGHTHMRVTPTLNDSAARLTMSKTTLMGGLSVATSGASRTYQLDSGATTVSMRVRPQSGSSRTYSVTVRIAGASGSREQPAPPRNVQVAAGNAKLTLTWRAPAHWGDFPASGYEVDWYAGASVPTQETDWKRATPVSTPLPATDTSYTFTGTYGSHTVANGTAYQLRIRSFSTNPDDDTDTLPGTWVVVSGTPQQSSLSSNANLGGLSVSTSTSRSGVYATLDIGTFAAGTTAYTATVPNAVAWARLTPTVADTGKATVKAGKAGSLIVVSSGSPSAAFGLSVGANAIKVEVTAQDSTKKTYTVTVIRQAAQVVTSPQNGKRRVVWSGTLSVKARTGSAGVFGCDNADSAGKKCSETSVLTDDDFSYGGTSYTIKAIGGGAAAGGIFITLGTGQDWNSLRDMAVRVGSRTLTPIANIYRNPSEPDKIRFPGTGASWMAGQTVSLALLEHSHGPRPGTPTLGTVTTSGTTASFTISCVDRGWAPVTDYILWAGKSDGTWVQQEHAPVPVNPCPTVTATMTGLDSSTAYTFKVRARNLVARYSDWSNEQTATTGTNDDPTPEPCEPELVENPVTGLPEVIPCEQQQAGLPEVSIAAGPAAAEGEDAAFTVTAAPAPASDLAVSVTVSQSGDFVGAPALGVRTVTVPAGGTTASLTVATVDDGTDEPDGSVTAALAAGGGYTVSSSGGTATVAVADDDESLPAILAKRAVAREGTDAAAVFRVRLDRAASGPVAVDWATADGTGRWAGTEPARAGADYTAASGTLTFAPGETEGTVSVAIIDDAVDEGTEHFLLRLSNPRGARLAPGHRETQGLIRNSDHLPGAWLSRFGRTVGSQVSDAVSGRLAVEPGPGAHMTLAGQGVNLAGDGDGPMAFG